MLARKPQHASTSSLHPQKSAAWEVEYDSCVLPRQSKQREKERKKRESTKNITSPRILHWSYVGGSGAGVVRKKVKENVRGPDLLAFIDNLVQASYINQIFCPVLFTHAQPALGALPQEVSGDRGTEHKCQGEAGAGSEQCYPTSTSLDCAFTIVTVTMFETKKCLCLVLHRWQKQINKIRWLEKQHGYWRLEAG